MSKENIKLDIREDGIYMVLNNETLEKKPTRKHVLEYIEEYKIDNVDHNALNELLSSTEKEPIQKISNITSLPTKNEGIDIETSKDRMEGYIKFNPAEFGGSLLTFESIMDELGKFGINYGIIEDDIHELIGLKDLKSYSIKHTVAKGQLPVNGIDGELIFNFDSEKSQPKILSDGSVDYKEIGFFVSVKAGDVLAYRTNPTLGTAGTDIFSRPVNQKAGKIAPKFSKGKNVYISDDEIELKAQISGELVVSGKSIGVSPVLEIKGDVGYETGNIVFEGSVNVGGGIISGFTVEAQGNVEVKGVVEGATIVARGAVNLYGGVQGMHKANISAGGDFFSKFVQNATITVVGDIKSNALLHSKVISKGSITLEGDNCIIVGGDVEVGGGIKARTIGSAVGTTTNIKAGNNPDLYKKYEDFKKEYSEALQKYKKINSDYEAIVKADGINELDNKRKRLVLQLVNSRMSLRKEIAKYEEEMTELTSALKKAKGQVIVEKIMFRGVNLTIANNILRLDDDISASRFRNLGGRIKVEPL